jgi:hypothetical protein
MCCHIMSRFSTRTVLVAVAGLATCGCTTALNRSQVAASQMSERVEALVAANRTYPRWADFPAAPVDLPTSQALAARVDDLQGSSLRLAGETSSIDWTLDDPETLAAETRRAVGAVPTSPDAVRTEAEVEAFARRLRERAKAPPPIDRQP